MRWVSVNKNVLSSRLNSVRQMSCCRSSAGRLFHSRGPATPKLLSPSLDCVRGTVHVWTSATCSAKIRTRLGTMLRLLFCCIYKQFLKLYIKLYYWCCGCYLPFFIWVVKDRGERMMHSGLMICWWFTFYVCGECDSGTWREWLMLIPQCITLMLWWSHTCVTVTRADIVSTLLWCV